MQHPLLARTVRGVEDVAAAEIEARLVPRSLAVGHRTVRFGAALAPELLELGTVDDVFLVLATAPDPGRTRTALAAAAGLGELDGRAALAALRTVRELRGPLGFDVVASFLGRRNYSRFELADRVAAAVAASTGWARRPRAPLSLRLHLDGERATLALRLGERPLHRRAYRRATVPGSLHPPLARALALLAGTGPGLTLLDPCCGAGTIPIEARLAEPRLRAIARDLDPAALGIAAGNRRAAGVGVELGVGDAGRVRLPDGSVDLVVVNPPWGLASRAHGRIASVWRETARLLGEEGRVVAVAPPAAGLTRRLAAVGLPVQESRWVRVAGAEVEVVVAAQSGSSRAAKKSASEKVG